MASPLFQLLKDHDQGFVSQFCGFERLVNSSNPKAIRLEKNKFKSNYFCCHNAKIWQKKKR
jgi:hypothetical protein